MSDIAQRIDPDSTVALIVQQWTDATRLQTLARGLLGTVQDFLTRPLAAMEEKTRIETADGVWMDWIGERLGQARPPTNLADFNFFGFEGSGGVGFSQGIFASVNPFLSPRVPVGDEFYRCVLLIRSRFLLSDGSAPSLEHVLRTWFPDATVEDNQDMSITLDEFIEDLDPNLLQAVRNAGSVPSPSGVGVSFEEEENG